MKPYFVVNPRSANGATGRRWLELDAQVSRVVGPHGLGFTSGPLDAMRLTREALRSGYDRIVAVGGDGTLNEVVNGFFEEGRLVAPGASLGVLPRGTGGDFRRTFGWSSDLEEALERVRSGRTQALDVGELRLQGPDGAPVHRHFVNICSFGASGEVVHEVNRASKALGGRASFYLGTFRALRRYRDRRILVRLDDGPEQAWEVTTVAVANGRYFGGGMCVAPEADPSDGLFDVTLWSGYGMFDFALKSPGVYSGKHVNWEGTHTFRCKRLEARCEDRVRLDVDGEQPGELPLRITMLPGALRLCT